MPAVYSTYEAKARLSEIIRKVRLGQSVLISYRGEPVAEVRPLPKRRSRDASRALRDLQDKGILSAPGRNGELMGPIARKPGALRRFLEERE